MKTGLQFTVLQFRAIFISWTILSIFYGISIASSTATIAESMVAQKLQFQQLPVFITSLFLLSVLIPLNVIAFYVAHFKINKFLTMILNVLPFLVIPPFIYWAICISSELLFNDFVWMTLFVGSYVVMGLRQGQYFEYRKKGN
jgi:hypothetical protein